MKEEDRRFWRLIASASTFTAATRLVAQEGLTIEAKQGTLAHSAVAIARAAGRELWAYASHFGLSPSTENAVVARGANDGSNDNPLAG